MEPKFGVTREEAVDDLAQRVESAASFMTSEYSDVWEEAERYYAGGCDVPYDEGRSSIIKTVVRDTIRAMMPSIMRTLMHSRKPVEYVPSSIKQAAFVEQQGLWVVQEFFKNDGYMQLYSMILESLKMGGGPVKVVWEDNPVPEHIHVTAITAAEAMQYMEQPDLVVTEVTPHEYQEDSPFEGSELMDLKAVRYYENGRLRLEAFPMYEFFCERNGSSLDDCVHGHRRLTTVADAIALGIDYDDWESIDAEDPEMNGAAGASRERRGYSKEGVDMSNPDPLGREILLTEAYCMYDLNGDGIPERYCFFLGGTSYTYLAHEEVEEFCIDVVRSDPTPFSIIGRSVVNLLKSSQDTITSLFRVVVDNGHIANNPRVAGDPTTADFSDIMNNAIGAPIKTRGPSTLQVFDIPFTAGGLLPVIDWLERDSEVRAGVTKAATGLDPDAMQSTDKNAVMNTIQMSQGQIELVVRNVIETALIPMFRKILRLSMRHMSPNQLMRYKGAVIPVDISNFNADLCAEPNVGLGTAAPQQKLQTLGFIYNEQKQYMAQFGLDNPFVSLGQVYNTIEDMVELGGLHNVGRYFNLVDKTSEKVIAAGLAKQAAEAAAQAAQSAPKDPSVAFMAVEKSKDSLKRLELLVKQRGDELDAQERALALAMEDDYKRDKMAQERVLEFAKLRQMGLSKAVKDEQDASTPKARPPTAPLIDTQQSPDTGGLPAVAAE